MFFLLRNPAPTSNGAQSTRDGRGSAPAAVGSAPMLVMRREIVNVAWRPARRPVDGPEPGGNGKGDQHEKKRDAERAGDAGTIHKTRARTVPGGSRTSR
jgi:hypothetical protein